MPQRCHTRGVTARCRFCSRLTGAAFAGVLLVLVAACSSAPKPVGDPDPGHRLMRQIVGPVLTAVPQDATVSHMRRSEPSWDSCDGQADTYGWDPVDASAEFRTHLGPGMVVTAVKSALRDLGWSFRPHLSGHGGWLWYRKLVSGKRAHAELDGGPASNQRFWDLTASTPPATHPVHGC